MAEKPILFNTEMVKAILEGRKTQTRRVAKISDGFEVINTDKDGYIFLEHELCPHCYKQLKPPYAVGDTLWVRETWNGDWCDHYIYKADGGSAKAAGYDKEPRWRPSIHMPRSAARLFLKVTDVRVERIQDITDTDCFKEGIYHIGDSTRLEIHERFKRLWDSVYNNWSENPWVWVIEFERIR